MVRQYEAQVICDIELRKHGLWIKGWRTNFTKVDRYIALCDHTNKRITISVPHLNARSESELKDTIWHEIAHAIVGHGHGHDDVWKNKALELGCKNPGPCGDSNVEAGRAITEVERIPPKKLKAVETYCPVCFKVAVTKAQTLSKPHIVTGVRKTLLKLECGHVIEKEQLKNPLEGIENWTSASGKVVYPFQVEGIRFVGRANGRALIADEPGLGKTIQALGSLKFYSEMRPALWVCKTTLKLQAVKEAFDWCGFVCQIIQHGRMYIMPGMDIYIVSMDLLRNIPKEKLDEIPFKTVVADEIQHFKNPDSTRTSELRKLVARAEFFLPLSGTPWKNRGSEYFPVLNMLRSDLFPSPKHFRNNWVEYEIDPSTKKIKEFGIRNIKQFRELTKDFIIRRMRDDVLPDLPKIRRELRFVDMEEEYAKEYDKAESKIAAILKAAIIDGAPAKQIASMIMQLKHVTGLAKVGSCIDDVTEWIENVPDPHEKLTIFIQHIDVGDNLQQGHGKDYEGLDSFLVRKGWNKTLRLLGGRSAEERDRIIKSFQNDPKNRILIASTLASGEGLNIQFCQNAYMLERQWNPQNEEQAELRFSRPLTKTDLPEYLYPLTERKTSIRVPYFIAAGTVDEILSTIVERKRLAFRKTMNTKDENITWNEAELIHEVAEAIIRKRFKKSAQRS